MKFTAQDPNDFQRDHFRWYEGELLGWEASEGKFGSQVKFRVQFDGEDREQWVFATARVTPNTKLGRLIKGWGGVDIEPGVELDLDEILAPGDRVKVMYGPQEKDADKTTEKAFERA